MHFSDTLTFHFYLKMHSQIAKKNLFFKFPAKWTNGTLSIVLGIWIVSKGQNNKIILANPNFYNFCIPLQLPTYVEETVQQGNVNICKNMQDFQTSVKFFVISFQFPFL